jgi:hypothetical protein
MERLLKHVFNFHSKLKCGHSVSHFINVLLVSIKTSFLIQYQFICLGRIPFQPYDGVRNDRDTMKQILRSIPIGSISGKLINRKPFS